MAWGLGWGAVLVRAAACTGVGPQGRPAAGDARGEGGLPLELSTEGAEAENNGDSSWRCRMRKYPRVEWVVYWSQS